MTVITMARGTAREVIIPVTDENGAPLDLSGNASARFWVGKSINSVGDDVWLKKEVGTGITITNDGNTPPLFSLNIAISAADSEWVEPRDSYYYEVRVVDQGGNPYVVAGDTFQLKPSLDDPPP